MSLLDEAEAREFPRDREEKHHDPTRKPPAAGRIVVVGNGMAGARTVEEILARDPERRFHITMFGAEPYGNYNRILLSNLLAGVEQEDGIYLNALDWYRDNHITLHSGTKVTKIDRWAKVVEAETPDGTRTTTPYDTLILATGSRPFFPPLEGMRPDGDPDGLAPGVFGFRTLDDTRAMMAYAEGHRTAVVIGGGLLGLEAARGLQQNHGLDVHVVHATDTLMNQQLVKNAGDILLKSVNELGITVHMDAKAAKVHTAEDGSGKVTGLEFDDGTVIACDMIVVTAGIRPVTELGAQAGLTVERAIVVDDQMRSVDDDDIYVVGECAQHRGEVYGLVAPLWEQGVVIAEHLTGENPRAAYHGSRTATKLKVAGVDVAAIGLKAPEREDDEYVVFSEPRRGVYKSVIVRDDKLVGATLLGDVRKVAFLTQAFDNGLPLPEERVELMFDLGGPPDEVSAEELPDETQVCNCNGVSKGELVGCVRDLKSAGAETTVGAVITRTRAGKGCGTCKGMVKQIVEWAAGDDIGEDLAANWYVPGIPKEKPELMAAIREQELRSVSAVFAALAPGGKEDAASKMPLASLLKVIWNGEFLDEKDARFINDRVHANIQRDGTFSVVPQMKGGVTTPAQLKKIAEVAEKYEVPMVKLTGGQRIDLLGIRKEALPAVWADLGMPSGYAYGKSFRTVKTCVGSDFCRFGLGDSTNLGIALEERYQGLESPAKLKLAVAGCPRNCSEALVKDLGVVAVGDGRWDILVGGAAGASVRKGDVLATVDSPEKVLTLAGRFLQYYRENAKWLERTYDFVPRIGIERLRELIVEDSEGLAEGLDARVQEAVDAYVDPWQKDGSEPATPGQFRPSLPLVDLPLVPVR